jgi:hypothetical protein
MPAYSVVHLGQLAADLGLCLRNPFFDRRVVELLTAMPLRLRHDAVVLKPLLRAAVDPLLPPSIAHRTFGPSFDDFFHEMVRRERPHYAELFAAARLEELGLVERGGLSRLLSNAADSVDLIREILAAVAIEGWLQAIEQLRPEPSFNFPAHHSNAFSAAKSGRSAGERASSGAVNESSGLRNLW